jgi:hypothetical protein
MSKKTKKKEKTNKKQKIKDGVKKTNVVLLECKEKES